jgi:enoyl-CoA hydratase/carnithine racemase
MSLKVEREERVLRITLNRPEKRNALTAAMCAAIAKHIEDVQEDRDIGSILLDAEGTVFSAGMDLDEASDPAKQHLLGSHERLFTIGATSRKPIVVCVNGPALGGGMGLVAQGHVVVAAQGALFGLTEIRVGLWPFAIYRAVEAALGPRRTLELSLTGRVFSTQDALTWGLVHQVTLPFEVDDRAAAISRDLAWASPTAIAAGLDYVRGSRCLSAVEQGELALSLRAKVMASEDFQEGVLAFKQHRDVRWPSMPEYAYPEEVNDLSPEPEAAD